MREIRQNMDGLSGADAKKEAVHLAKLHDCSVPHIYKVTQDLRKHSRNIRKDKGKRKWELTEGTDIWTAVELVIADNLDPDLALLTAQERGCEDLPELTTFRHILNENGLNRRSRKRKKRPHRRFEAEFPGQIFQVDATGLKKRWLDLNTRSVLQIEGIDKNHPNLDSAKERVWQLGLVDDFSRRVFMRYVHTRSITSTHIVHFLCEAFEILGVCETLYTDNGAEFKGRHKTAESILNKILENDGGYRHQTHLPHNAQATGKVENFHKFAEKMDMLIGLAITEGQIVTIEKVNQFADEICRYKNEVIIHRSTGQKPIDRWFSKRSVIRKLPTEIVKSALLSDEFDAVLNPDLTISRNNISYQVPGKRPFVNYIEQTVAVVIPDEIDFILITLPGESHPIEIPKLIAGADTAGEFKTHAESNAQQIKKRVKETRREGIREIKQARKLTGEIAPVPFFNTLTEVPADNTIHFPHEERTITPDEIAEAVPNKVPPSVYQGRQIRYWEAVGMYADEFKTPSEAREFLRTVFADDETLIPQTKVEESIQSRSRQVKTTKLRIA